MNGYRFYLLMYLCVFFSRCSGQKAVPDKDVVVQKGVLVYYMSQPYFFPVIDTSFERISTTNVVGLKLGKIDLNDILDSVSHKRDIVVYVANDNNKIDTIRERASVMLAELKTKPVKTKLQTDTNAFSLVSGNMEWVFRYEFRYDLEIVSVRPILSVDIKAFNLQLKKNKE